MNICKDCKHRTFGEMQAKYRGRMEGKTYVCTRFPGDLVPVDLVTGSGGERKHSACEDIRERVGNFCPDHSNADKPSGSSRWWSWS